MADRASEERRRSLIVEGIRDIQRVLGEVHSGVLSAEVDARVAIFFAFYVRLVVGTDGVFSLLKKDQVEDIWCLARPLAEGCFNACYLMTADQSEVVAYMSGHIPATSHRLQQFEAMLGERFSGVDNEERERRQEARTEAEAKAGREIGKREWSRFKLEQRVQATDRVIQLNIFEGLYRTLYSNAHEYIHCNFKSLADFHHKILGTPEQDLARYALANLALSQIAQIYSVLLVFVSTFLRPDLQSAFDAAHAKFEEAHLLSGLPIGNFTLGPRAVGKT